MVLPHIIEIGYASYNPEAVLWPLFVNMLDSRLKVGKRALRVAELLFADSRATPDSVSEARIESLREAGLQISLLFNADADDRVDRWLHRTAWKCIAMYGLPEGHGWVSDPVVSGSANQMIVPSRHLRLLPTAQSELPAPCSPLSTGRRGYKCANPQKSHQNGFMVQGTILDPRRGTIV
ncbi:hypothetical protein C8R45DRAFT_947387 [Mycena sanguinolenta]|nr:hypothetical protein C8R45DRAFT_947387 [Mycena sanguinolenta]